MAKPSKPSKSKSKAKPSKAKPKAKATKATKAKPSRKVPGGGSAKAKPAKATPKRRQTARIRRLPPAELDRRLQLARDAASNQPLRRRWELAMERMRDHFGEATGIEPILRIATPPAATKGTPWAMVARIGGFDGTLGWLEAHDAFQRTEGDDRVEDLIGAARLCRIAARYRGPETRGGDNIIERDFTLSEIAPWPFAISHAVQRCDPGSEESLVARYGSTKVLAIYVWISLDEARGRSPTLAT